MATKKKKPNRKPTAKQRKVAEQLIINTQVDVPLTSGEIVENSGYGVSMKKNPHVILQSDGVQMALEEYGFTEDNAKKVVAGILLDPEVKASDRLKASEQVFKVRGSYAPDKHASVNVELKGDIKDIQKAEELGKKYEEELRGLYLSGDIKKPEKK